jgi:hypothetical protein
MNLQPHKAVPWMIAIALVALIVGVQQGYAECATASPQGPGSGFCTNAPDPACGTTTILKVSWTNYCVSEPCSSATIACNTTNACVVKTCPGGTAMKCSIDSQIFCFMCTSCSC